jgi:arylsulfatase A-like enzyme
MNDNTIPKQTSRAHKFNVPQSSERPNILILMTDQQRFDTIAAAGYGFMHTPNLDRLVSEGCLYTHAYTPNPICLAARHNLLTGLPARYHGFPDNMHNAITKAEIPTLPRILADNGYDTRAIGKMHFRPARRHNGFNKMELMEELPKTREEDEYAMYLKSVGLGHIQNIHGVRNLLYMLPQRSLIPSEHHGTKWVGDRSIEFIRTNKGRQPFFLLSSWIAPHPPFDVIDEYADLYRNAELPIPYVSMTPLAVLTRENAMLGDLPNEAYVRRMREVYYAAISMVDEQVGRILDVLQEVGQIDNTLIIFTSDHGEFLGDYGLTQKWNPYDVCTRVPLIVRYPKSISAGMVKDDFVDLNDILPTALDVSGILYPGSITLPGESLLAEAGEKDREWQYTEYGYGNRRWISICNKRFKYNYYYGGGIEQLFDMQNDPHETVNLLHGSLLESSISTAHELRLKLTEYESQWGLEGYVNDDGLKQGAPYEPHPQRNEAFPRFPLMLTDDNEKEAMNGFVDEVAMAVAKEPVVKIRKLDYQAWQMNLGIPDAELERLLTMDDQKASVKT